MKTQTDHLLTPGSFRGQHVLVVGLGRFQGGVSVSRWLAGQGADVTITDQANADTLQSSLASLDDLNIKAQLGSHDTALLTDIDLAIINPAVNKRRSAFFAEIVKRGIPWTTEINLFCQRCPATVIGVTGTFGKSTTCAMLAHVLRDQHVATHTPFTNVHLGGNIGRSLLPQLSEMLPSDVVVLELSSTQLEDIPTIRWQPDLAIVTNLSPHHIDWHETFQQYAHAKLQLLGDGHIKKGVVLGPLDAEVESLFLQKLNLPSDHIIRPTISPGEIKLRIPGAHNQANAITVLSACQLLGIEDAPARNALATFQGLPHRLAHVGTIDGVDYYNDSKSTAPTASLSAVYALDRPIIAIVGGKHKPQPLADWAAIMASKCRVIICIGESGPDFAQAIQSYLASYNEPQASARANNRPEKNVQISNSRNMKSQKNILQSPPTRVVQECSSITSALEYARNIANRGDAVLFSPGAASFDQFNNYEHRGEVFLACIRALT